MKKIIKKSFCALLIVLSLVLTFAFSACGQEVVIKETGDTPDKYELSMYYGDTIDLIGSKVTFESGLNTVVKYDKTAQTVTAVSTGTVKGKADGAEFTIEVKAHPVDIMLFAGQSNMVGSPNNAEADTVIPVAEGHGFEYKAKTGSDSKGWFGEVPALFGNDNYIHVNSGASKVKGSLAPAFMESYYLETGVPLIGVRASQGGKKIELFMEGGEYHNNIKKGLAECVERTATLENYELRNIYMAWCQGESNASPAENPDSVTLEDGKYDFTGYKNQLKELYNSLKVIKNTKGETIGEIEKCFVISISEYSNAGTDYGSGHMNSEEKNPDKVAMNEAQAELCAQEEDFVFVSRKLTNVPSSLRQDPHFHQEVYNVCGWDAGINTAYYLETGNEPECESFVAGEEEDVCGRYGITCKYTA